MKIKEIMTIGSRLEPIQKYEQLFVDIPMALAFNNLTFAEDFLDNETHILGLFNTNNLVSVLKVEIRNEPYWQITYSQTEPAYQRQGCFRYLLEKAVNFHTYILSDDSQTIESQKAWTALEKLPGKLQILQYNTITKKTSKVNFKEVYSTSTPEKFLLLATKTLATSAMTEHFNKSNEFKKKSNRDYVSLWFGPASSNEEYINP